MQNIFNLSTFSQSTALLTIADNKKSGGGSETYISISRGDLRFCKTVFAWRKKKETERFRKILANARLSLLQGPFSEHKPPWSPRPRFARVVMQAASWPGGSVSITPQQQFHFPSEAKQFQSLEMFLITSVVYECYMIRGIYIKNICSFQKFLNFSQNYIRRLTLQPLSLSSYTVFLNVTWTWVSSFWSSEIKNICIILRLWLKKKKKNSPVKIFQPNLIYYPL